MRSLSKCSLLPRSLFSCLTKWALLLLQGMSFQRIQSLDCSIFQMCCTTWVIMSWMVVLESCNGTPTEIALASKQITSLSTNKKALNRFNVTWHPNLLICAFQPPMQRSLPCQLHHILPSTSQLNLSARSYVNIVWLSPISLQDSTILIAIFTWMLFVITVLLLSPNIWKFCPWLS